MNLTQAIKVVNQNGNKCRRLARSHRAYKPGRCWLNGDIREKSDIIRMAKRLEGGDK